MNRKTKFILPTPEEDATINAGIAADPVTYELTDKDFKQMKPLTEILKNRGGRPKLAHPKEPVTIHYDAEVLAAFRATGEGWQTRMNDALKDWLRTHRPNN